MMLKGFCCCLLSLVLLLSACIEGAKQVNSVNSANYSSVNQNINANETQINSNALKEATPANQTGNTNKCVKSEAAKSDKTDDDATAFDGLDERKVPRPLVIKSIKPETAKDPKLEEFLHKYLTDAVNDKEKVKYSYNLVDLNDDGTPEIIIYLEGSFCGTGGCPSLVVANRNGAYNLITDISLTKGDFLVGEQKTNGWRDLISFVSGGGYVLGHYVLLKFDGTTYPENPTVEPAMPLSKRIKGIRYLAGNVNFTLNVMK